MSVYPLPSKIECFTATYSSVGGSTDVQCISREEIMKRALFFGGLTVVAATLALATGARAQTTEVGAGAAAQQSQGTIVDVNNLLLNGGNDSNGHMRVDQVPSGVNGPTVPVSTGSPNADIRRSSGTIPCNLKDGNVLLLNYEVQATVPQNIDAETASGALGVPIFSISYGEGSSETRSQGRDIITTAFDDSMGPMHLALVYCAAAQNAGSLEGIALNNALLSRSLQALGMEWDDILGSFSANDIRGRSLRLSSRIGQHVSTIWPTLSADDISSWQDSEANQYLAEGRQAMASGDYLLAYDLLSTVAEALGLQVVQ